MHGNNSGKQRQLSGGNLVAVAGASAAALAVAACHATQFFAWFVLVLASTPTQLSMTATLPLTANARCLQAQTVQCRFVPKIGMRMLQLAMLH